MVMEWSMPTRAEKREGRSGAVVEDILMVLMILLRYLHKDQHYAESVSNVLRQLWNSAFRDLRIDWARIGPNVPSKRPVSNA